MFHGNDHIDKNNSKSPFASFQEQACEEFWLIDSLRSASTKSKSCISVMIKRRQNIYELLYKLAVVCWHKQSVHVSLFSLFHIVLTCTVELCPMVSVSPIHQHSKPMYGYWMIINVIGGTVTYILTLNEGIFKSITDGTWSSMMVRPFEASP